MTKNIAKLSLLMTLLISGHHVMAQSEVSNIDENIIGVLIGGTISNISNYEADNKLGFQAGVYWEWRFSEKFSTMPNITYTERGAKGNDGLPDAKLAYLAIPLQLKYNVSEKFAIATGIAWDVLIFAKGDGVEFDNFRDDDWRIPIILGYNISDKLSIGVSYNIGLLDITKTNNTTNKNNWGSISIAYKILKR